MLSNTVFLFVFIEKILKLKTYFHNFLKFMVYEFLKINVLTFFQIHGPRFFEIQCPKDFCDFGLFNRLAQTGVGALLYDISPLKSHRPKLLIPWNIISNKTSRTCDDCALRQLQRISCLP